MKRARLFLRFYDEFTQRANEHVIIKAVQAMSAPAPLLPKSTKSDSRAFVKALFSFISRTERAVGERTSNNEVVPCPQ